MRQQRQELTDELSKRKAMQYQLIKSEERCCDLLRDLAERAKQITQLQSDNLKLRQRMGDSPRTGEKRHISAQRCIRPRECSSPRRRSCSPQGLYPSSNHSGSSKVAVAPKEKMPVPSMEANAAVTNLTSPGQPGFAGSERIAPMQWSGSAPRWAMSGSMTVSASTASNSHASPRVLPPPSQDLPKTGQLSPRLLPRWAMSGSMTVSVSQASNSHASPRVLPSPFQDLPKTAQPPPHLLQIVGAVVHERQSTPLRPGVCLSEVQQWSPRGSV